MNEDIHKELVSISAIIGKIPKCNPYHVPENYFNNLYEQALSITKSEETDTISDLQSSSTFLVPENYFEGIADDILLKIHQNNKKYTPIRFLYKSLAAAVIIGCLGFSVFFLFNASKMIKEKDDSMSSVMKSAHAILQNNDMNNEFYNINEKDASEYLLSHGEDLNSALVASLYDESSLPSEEEILYNPSFIDNYLKKLQIVYNQPL